ncbi:MAG: hypothetical protein ACE5HS_07235 [bacterium]
MHNQIKIALCFLALSSFGLRGQENTISIDSNVDKSTIRIGDVVKYAIVVMRSPEVQVEMPGLAANLDQFEIRNYQTFEPESQEGQIVERVEYEISTFDVGEFEIPPLVFRYTLPGDSTQHTLKTKKLKIVVESLLDSEAGDVRDIKSVLEILLDYRQWIVWGSVALAFLILTGVSIYIWRRKRAGKGLLPQKIVPPRPAHEIALDELRALQQSTYLQEGQTKEYYVRISEIIRKYIEGRYFIIALELTTHELIEMLSASESNSELVEMVQDFLERCDLVKFAKYQPNDAEHSAVFQQAIEIVEKSKLIYDIEEEQSEAEKPFDEASEEVKEDLMVENVEEPK